MNSQSILPASCTSSCLMLMIWSSRARNRSPDPVVSCFFGRIAPSDAATESCFSIRGNCENEFASSRASDTETLQSQVNKAAKKRLSLSGLEILHGRLRRAAGAATSGSSLDFSYLLLIAERKQSPTARRCPQLWQKRPDPRGVRRDGPGLGCGLSYGAGANQVLVPASSNRRRG